MTPPISKGRRCLRFAVLGMALAGVAATGIAFLSDWHWYADLFAHLRPQYCVWLALAALGSVVVKNRPALLLAIIGFPSFRDSIAERTCLRDSIASVGRGRAMELRGQGRAEMEFRHE